MTRPISATTPSESPTVTASAADPHVLDALLREYWQPLVTYADRLLGDRALAEEIVQRGFVRLWERKHRLPPAGEVRPFLYRMVRNLVSNEWRRSANHAHWQELMTREASDRSSVCSHELLEAAELEQALDVAIDSLPPRRREVFVLSRYHTLSNAQIAEVLGLSTQTVANQLVLALRTLRELLQHRLEESPTPHLRILRSDES